MNEPLDPTTCHMCGCKLEGERAAAPTGDLPLCPDCHEAFLADGEPDAFLDEAFWLELRLKRRPVPPEELPA
ncbi:hypothetical protein [Anaeromyxobacter paludicola]|uniref:Uncharacterized protein n=1 Tax=Anaeromyxobacter paludicola TaxID=2918171 RepID=A0ABN6N7Z8_9BACT|nr:hypothetical protein [Anaeromyxobacter paludicola]BDG09319.1 hypothetical protein AMPC_24320 [Anaeromyxobacter paludicola]